MTLRALSSTLQVHCPPYHVQLAGSQLSAINAIQAPRWLADEGWTILQIPVEKGMLSLSDVKEWMSGWGHAGLLFLRSVTNVSLHDENGYSVCTLCLNWTAEATQERFISGEQVQVVVRRAQDPGGNSFRVHTANFASPAHVRRHGKAKGEQTSIAVALPLSQEKDHWVHAGLPVARTHIPARIAAQFDTLSNRQGLAPSAWNHWLVPHIGQLWLSSIIDLLATSAELAWPLIPIEAPEDPLGASIIIDLEHQIFSLASESLANMAHLRINGKPVAVAKLAVEEVQLENVLREEEIARLAGCDHALPRSSRDAGRAWWLVLEKWRKRNDSLPAPVTTSSALALLDEPSFVVSRRVTLAAVAIDESLGDLLYAHRSIALADGGIVAPPQANVAEMLVSNSGSLAEELGVGLHIHSAYLGDSAEAQSVHAWLRSQNALIEDDDALALLKRIAQAGRCGRHIAKPLTESQLASLRNAFEAVPSDEQQALGQAVGRAIQLIAYTFDTHKREIATVCSPAQTYLPRAIDRESDSFAVAAARTPGLYWVSGKYANALKSSLGRTGLGAQRFLRLLGVELAPRLKRHAALYERYSSDRRKGLHIGHGPLARTHAMRAIDAEYTLEDWESPDLQRVVMDISSEKRLTPRRERARALLATLARAWDRLSDMAEVTAASTNYGWFSRGPCRAYWLWAASEVEWLEDVNGRKRKPFELRLRTPAAVAIYGSNGTDYLRMDFHSAGRQQVLEALGVQGEASTGELIRHLQSLRSGSMDPASAELETETAVVYHALAARFPGGRAASDMTTRVLQREFGQAPGLILNRRGWRRPSEVLIGPPSFGNYRDYVPAVVGSENLWRALQVRIATIEDCITVMQDVAQRRKTLEGEERAVVIETLRLLSRLLSAAGVEATVGTRMRKAPLWTSLGWTRERPVYAIDDPAIAASLADHVAVWDPGCEISILKECLAPMGVHVVSSNDSEVVEAEAAVQDDEASELFSRAIAHLHDDLSRNEPKLAAALALPWDELRAFGVRCDSDLRILLSGVVGWDEKKPIPVRAKAMSSSATLFVRDTSELRRVDAGGRAIATLFDADPRKIAHAWLAACDKAEHGIAQEEIVAAEEAQKIEAERLAQNVHERTLRLQAQTAGRRAAAKSPQGRSSEAPAPSAGVPSQRPPAPALPPRILVNPDNIRLTNPHGIVSSRTQPPSKAVRPYAPLPAPRPGNSSPQDRSSLPTYSGLTKESLALALVRKALQYDNEQLQDLRAQLGVGADAVDELEQFFELKAYAQGEPDSIRLTDSEVKRAASGANFFLVVVSHLEGVDARPRIRFIADPLRQLDVTGSGTITVTGVRHAESLIFDFDHALSAPPGGQF
ncbi:hypothetical protein EXV95_18815 [Acidovorax sp. JMULE5]|uniref:hypothetical protein n=1 Tax=Acidovorax sp. JMULE5 TaxID=2518343 RepID=UPI0015A1BCF4|nr:hypothetical protein [Acidovorax sp. JMULE5]QLA82508.1 hypothetical protein EXV95_18815 [Acidovorax sp. JMULE5]